MGILVIEIAKAPEGINSDNLKDIFDSGANFHIRAAVEAAVIGAAIILVVEGVGGLIFLAQAAPNAAEEGHLSPFEFSDEWNSVEEKAVEMLDGANAHPDIAHKLEAIHEVVGFGIVEIGLITGMAFEQEVRQAAKDFSAFDSVRKPADGTDIKPVGDFGANAVIIVFAA